MQKWTRHGTNMQFRVDATPVTENLCSRSSYTFTGVLTLFVEFFDLNLIVLFVNSFDRDSTDPC